MLFLTAGSFFRPAPSSPQMGKSPGREFVALFLFDNDGTLIEDLHRGVGEPPGAWVGWLATRKQSVRQRNRRRHRATSYGAWRRHIWGHRNPPVWDGSIWHDFRISAHGTQGRWRGVVRGISSGKLWPSISHGMATTTRRSTRGLPPASSRAAFLSALSP